ncbi:MAG: hypothetical protein WCK13_06660 [Ignavibacteriota bacterium]|nr:hypothetical protein [Ignavibacteriota bacterium]
MKKHNGMRPLDIVVLLKITIQGKKDWQFTDLSRELYISQSEISESLNRSSIARLISPDRRKVLKNSFLEFLIYGLKYVFPVRPGSMARGIPTAHSAKPLSDVFKSNTDLFVWEYDEGSVRGQSIQPLYPKAIKAAKDDSVLYELLALADAIRVGSTREFSAAVKELKKRIK